MAIRTPTTEEFFNWRSAHGFKNRRWRYAATVHTPLERLDWFVPTLLATISPIRDAVIRITQVVFEPKALNAHCETQGVAPPVADTPALRVDTAAELSGLLQAVFADWLDFGVYIIPARLALAADHDEWTRVFAHSKSDLSPVSSTLKAGGIRVIEPPHRLGTMRTGRLTTWDD
jgi:hypothetical protein